MNVIVRRAGRRDLEGIHALWLLLQEVRLKADARFQIAKDAPEIASDHREVILADPNSAFFVAEEQREIVGYLHAQVESNDPTQEPLRIGRIVELIIREDLRRAGIGSRLFGYCKEWLSSLGIVEYRATVPAQDATAQTFLAAQSTTPLTITYQS